VNLQMGKIRTSSNYDLIQQ